MPNELFEIVSIDSESESTFLRLQTRDLSCANPYKSLYLPVLPVCHPYSPIKDANEDEIICALISHAQPGMRENHVNLHTSVCAKLQLPIETANTLIPDLTKLIRDQNIEQENVDFCIVMQDRPWMDPEELEFRPHPWVHSEAPAIGNYNVDTTVHVAIIATNNGQINDLQDFSVVTHGSNNEGVVFSPDNMQLKTLYPILGGSDKTDQFYSICIIPAKGTQPARMAVTLHYLLNDNDQAIVAAALQASKSHGVDLGVFLKTLQDNKIDVSALGKMLKNGNNAVAPRPKL